ncbi:MAG: hypothetical protein IJV48_00390 [Ruminococcus sp.]|nr:hypothetical protein [Ruminococcus sp.]
MMDLTSAALSQQITMAAGYTAQAAGIGIFSAFLRYRHIAPRTIFISTVIAYTVFLFPAVLSTSLVGTVIFGLLISLLCGAIAGYYLYELTETAGNDRRVVSFGIGYGLATVAAWLLSLIDGGSLYYGKGVIFICLALALLSVLGTFIKGSVEESEQKPQTSNQPLIRLRTLIILSGGVVLLFSLLNNIGFSFSTSELQGGFRVESSRVFYGVGLITAGFVTDKSRKYGAVCALAALVIPFIVLALRGEPVSYTVFWAIGYLAFGFYSVYRIILFSDIAKNRRLLYLSGFGLLIGRIGDALGSELSVFLEGNEKIKVILAAMLFMGSVFLFIKLFQSLYMPTARQKSEREIFHDFSAEHDLSAREREVLRLLLENKTNKEISEVICVSESTVKFHIHNLLSKTGCKNRTDLIDSYNGKR